MLTCEEVSIGPPNARAIWRAESYAGEDPFAPVGQIFLHDVDPQAATALVGYHLFDVQTRGKGVGTRALGLLQDYAVEESDLKRLVIITTRDNVASRRVAEKCGFEYVGPQRERPDVGVCYAWDVSP
jgi:RimJ/RimL family protein N-acetyltransferase